VSETTATNGAAGAPILELDNVHTYYGAIHALKGVSLTVGGARSSR